MTPVYKAAHIVSLAATLLWLPPCAILSHAQAAAASTATEAQDQSATDTIRENEVKTIGMLHAYVRSQLVYFANDWDGDGVNEYAQRLRSSPGRFDGLYWPPGKDVPESPAGHFTAEALYAEPVKDFLGYRFRILTSQGSNVPGDAYDYVINGNMVAGFALLAWPAEYGKGGIDTLMVSRQGTIYAKDLGPDTPAAVEAITSFNPDGSWSTILDTAGGDRLLRKTWCPPLPPADAIRTAGDAGQGRPSVVEPALFYSALTHSSDIPAPPPRIV